MNGAKQTERGQTVERGQELMRAVGMAGKEWTAGTQPAEQGTAGNTAGRRSVRHRPPETTSPQLAGLAAKTTAADQRRLAMQLGGGSAVVLAAIKAGADLPTPVPTPPIAFACHCPYPLP